MTGLDAAKKMMKERGYVVVGILPHLPCKVGEILFNFAGAYLDDHELVVTKPTDLADWDAQVLAIFGDPKKDKNGKKVKGGGTYWRATLRAGGIIQ